MHYFLPLLWFALFKKLFALKHLEISSSPPSIQTSVPWKNGSCQISPHSKCFCLTGLIPHFEPSGPVILFLWVSHLKSFHAFKTMLQDILQWEQILVLRPTLLPCLQFFFRGTPSPHPRESLAPSLNPTLTSSHSCPVFFHFLNVAALH